MGIAIIADSHLGGPGGDGEEFVEQLRRLPSQGCRRLILLGDIFHVWVGSPRFETPEVRKVIPELRRLREQGIEVEYVEGNRDFFIQNSSYSDAFDRIALETVCEVDGERHLFVHGDGLNDKDRQYLFWRRLSKSLPVRLLMFNLPSSVARKMMRSTEEKLAKTNFKHRKALPEEAIRRYGEARLAEGFVSLRLGHFHEPHHFDVPGGAVYCLDAWFRSRRVEWLGAEPTE